MPFGDGTGPLGQGPMTGRGVGFCAGYQRPGYTNPALGRRVGFGRGRGWRNWYRATGLPGWQRAGMGYSSTAKEEKEMTQEELSVLKEQVKALEARLEELKKKK